MVFVLRKIFRVASTEGVSESYGSRTKLRLERKTSTPKRESDLNIVFEDNIFLLESSRRGLVKFFLVENLRRSSILRVDSIDRVRSVSHAIRICSNPIDSRIG